MINVPSSFRALPDFIAAPNGLSAKKFIEKTLRVRARLLAEKKGSQHSSVLAAYNNVRNWYQFWKPTEQQCAAYVQRHRDLFELIIPGNQSKCHKAFLHELTLITNGINSTAF
jgi:hypothetical protein